MAKPKTQLSTAVKSIRDVKKAEQTASKARATGDRGRTAVTQRALKAAQDRAVDTTKDALRSGVSPDRIVAQANATRAYPGGTRNHLNG